MLYLWYLHCRAWDDWDMGIVRDVAEQHRGRWAVLFDPLVCFKDHFHDYPARGPMN
jgi:hypothetical protein